MNPNIPTIFIIFGATGDLMERKIAPSLFYLHLCGKLPKMFHVIGFARKNLSDKDFQNHVKCVVEKFAQTEKEKKMLPEFLKFFHYHQGNFDDLSKYESLAEQLGEVDGQWQVCANKLYHLAVPPTWYETIVQNLEKTNMHKGCGEKGIWTRVMVEKPFGRDLKSCQHLQKTFSKRFKESQMYRIDHYLGKEMIQDILSFRFSNDIFGDNWDKTRIEKIHVQHFEGIDIQGRGAFYESVGALRDMGQSHMLSMLAFLTMDHPLTFQEKTIRKRREEILGKILPVKNFVKDTVRAQYDGYKKEEDVSPKSQVETYFKVKLELKDPKWKGVPIILEHGKAVKQDQKQIVVYFKRPKNCFLCPVHGEREYDKIIISWEPYECISVRFLSKKPGLNYELEEREIHFSFRQGEARLGMVGGYAKLILDAILGDQTFFLTQKEIEASWKVVDPIEKAWSKGKVPLRSYKKGSLPSNQ